MTPIFHVVLLKFSCTATTEDIAETCEGILAYKHKCLHPETNEPLLVSIKGGVNCGTEELDGGFTYVFVLEFNSPEDLQRYLDHRHHVRFDQMLKTKNLLEDEIVLDFSPGMF